MTDDQRWFYCIEHDLVQQGHVCTHRGLMGPYPDEATASRSLQIARERTATWDEEDRDWEEGRS